MDTLARFQLKAEARRFALGYLWWIVEPLLYVAVFYVVFVKLMGNRAIRFLGLSWPSVSSPLSGFLKALIRRQ